MSIAGDVHGSTSLTIDPELAERVDLALARAVVYGAVTLALQPPSATSLLRLVGTSGAAALDMAADVVDGASGGVVRRRVLALREAGCPAAADLVADYDRLFGHTTRGLVCAFGTEYGASDLLSQPHALADVAGYYRAFGLTPTSSLRPDHIGCECEFMAFLCRKEAYTLAAVEDAQDAGVEDGQSAETLEATRAAERSFLRGHLGPFGPALARAMSEKVPGTFYGAVGALLGAVIEADARCLDVRLGPMTLTLRPVDADDTPMACGTDDLIQISGLRTRE